MTDILIADDLEQNLYMLRFLLESKGHQVQSAHNGQEALQLARQSPPDMIITDILMPVMDGFTLCREWQRDPRLQNIPFVFYSATYTDPKDIELGLSLGAARYIIKPMDPAELYPILAEVIEEYQAGQLTGSTDKLPEEPVFLKQYNERLIQKLEDKMVELEKANHQLEQANQQLEAEVAERTAELRQALQEAQQAERLKSQFISDINHELRAPLNNLMLYLGLLDVGPPAKREHYMHTLHREAERLQGLVSQLLDASLLNDNKVATNLEPLDLNQLVSTLLNDRHHLIQDNQLTLDIDLTEQLPWVLSDPQFLTQVLTNLLTNAVNYTPAGGTITIITATEEREGASWVTVSVQDDGPGISAEEQEKLFQRFFRGAAAAATQAPGSGLGLAICQEMMTRLRGELTVSSELGQGSRFTLWLPVAA